MAANTRSPVASVRMRRRPRRRSSSASETGNCREVTGPSLLRRLRAMSFEEGAGLDTSQVTGGGSGGRGGVVIGGGIGTLIIILLGAFFGVDLSGVVPSGSNPLDPDNVTTGGQESSESFNHC